MRLIFILILLFNQNIFAQGKPAWIDHLLFEDDEFKYYVGRASNAPSDSEAVFQATTDARRQSISSNFGTYIKFESRAYRSMEALSSSQSANEISGQVRMDGFEQKDIYFERLKDGQVNVWVLFKYPIKEIVKEKIRLEKIRTISGDDYFKLNEYGSENQNNNLGTIEIHSNPEGLSVKFDTYSDLFGKNLITPMLIKGVEIGHHIILINDSKYELYQNEIVVSPGVTNMVNAEMKKAMGTIKINTDPENATISIGSLTVMSPTKELQVPAGIPILIQIAHPETKRSTQEEVTIERNQNITKTYSLELKQALVSVNSSPENASVEIDGLNIGKTPINIPIQARKSHKIYLRFENLEYETSIDPIPGGGIKILPLYKLYEKKITSSSFNNNEDIPKKNHEQFDTFQKHNLLGIEYINQDQGSFKEHKNWGSCYWNLTYEYKFFKYVGFKGGFFFGGGKIMYKDASITNTAMGLKISMPIYLLDSSNSILPFFEPHFANMRNAWKVTYTDQSESITDTTQNSFGGGIGFIFNQHELKYPSLRFTIQYDLTTYSSFRGSIGNSSGLLHMGVLWDN